MVNFLCRWRDFGRSMFWLAIIFGSLILLHALLLVILKFRKKNPGKQNYGALTLARFEIFLIILAVPCICEASVSLIRGKFNAFLLFPHLNLPMHLSSKGKGLKDKHAALTVSSLQKKT